jgi:hypothetical protein
MIGRRRQNAKKKKKSKSQFYETLRKLLFQDFFRHSRVSVTQLHTYINEKGTFPVRRHIEIHTNYYLKHQPAPIFIGALTPGLKQKATSVRLSNPSYGLLESGKVGQKKNYYLKHILPRSIMTL